ncbi:hypothetical protein A2U01_0113188, partial [Trifolium medium]|nr:hypothetical protein [Trifolium medium]
MVDQFGGMDKETRQIVHLFGGMDNVVRHMVQQVGGICNPQHILETYVRLPLELLLQEQ